MRLLRVHVISADTCGGLLDGLDVWFRSPMDGSAAFEPLCLVGPNGSGKSQFLQVLAEVFQSVFHACSKKEERVEGNPDLQFQVEYLIRPCQSDALAHVRISRRAVGKRKPAVAVERKGGGKWVECDLEDPATQQLLPQKVVASTSGGNETLSLPFLVSRGGYADDVAEFALKPETSDSEIPDTRLMLIDYGTHLEVMVSNLLLGTRNQRKALLSDAGLKDIHSLRCVIQLAHSAAPKAPRTKAADGRKGVQLTEELEGYLENLRRCATCYSYDDKTETYVFDYWVNDATREAFGFFWDSALDLYSAFHKLSMLNDLAINRDTRKRFRQDTKTRRFASRLPEPQDEDKIFRFERVGFRPQGRGEPVDYVTLSDGEHQLGQILGMFCMLSFPNVLFLLDEPESHFNPQWRVDFGSKLLALSTAGGARGKTSAAAAQECLLTTHSPFVPSDMPRDQVFIFSKDKKKGKVDVRHPNIETFGTTFDTIVEECFGVRPPISKVPLDEIKKLMKSEDVEEIKSGMKRLGHSVEKAMLADRIRQLSIGDGG